MVLGKLPVPGRPTIWITVGQGPTALTVGAGGGGLDIFTLIYPFSPLSRFGHHENNCPVDLGSVCANCGAGGHDHHTSACKNAPKCVNCGKDHVSRSSNCEIWKKEKEICKIKVTKNITYLEAKKQFESQTSDLDFTKIVQSLSSKPESKTVGTQFFENDFTIHPSSKVGQTKVSAKT